MRFSVCLYQPATVQTDVLKLWAVRVGCGQISRGRLPQRPAPQSPGLTFLTYCCTLLQCDFKRLRSRVFHFTSQQQFHYSVKSCRTNNWAHTNFISKFQCLICHKWFLLIVINISANGSWSLLHPSHLLLGYMSYIFKYYSKCFSNQSASTNILIWLNWGILPEILICQKKSSKHCY